MKKVYICCRREHVCRRSASIYFTACISDVCGLGMKRKRELICAATVNAVRVVHRQTAVQYSTCTAVAER